MNPILKKDLQMQGNSKSKGWLLPLGSQKNELNPEKITTMEVLIGDSAV